MQKWKSAVRSEVNSTSTVKQYIKTTPPKYWGQMAAAVFIGVVLGGLLFGDLNPDVGQENIQIAYEDATTEVIYTNL